MCDSRVDKRKVQNLLRWQAQKAVEEVFAQSDVLPLVAISLTASTSLL